MARPSGWDILGLDGDPTPGVVESVQALAKEFGDFAHDVEAAYHSLNSFGGDANALQWIGQTADAFKSKFGPLPGRLQKLYTSYSEASDALSAYWPQLQAAQTKADTALRQAQDAHADLQRATTSATSAAADLKTAQQNQAANPSQQAVTDAQTAHDTAQTNLNNAKAKMAALTKQANDAYNDRITAAKTCGSALHHAQSDGIHNKSWWDHVAEDLSKWGGEIGKIAGELAPILDIIALATSWIPGVDVVTAALAEIDNIVALAGTALATIGDAMQGHWGDALMGAGMLALTFVGGRALGSGAEDLEGEAGALEGEAGALEGEEGSLARGAEGKEPAKCDRDPVDVVSGWMLTGATDVELPGVLPLVLRRAYASGYGMGRLFGPGWSSTLDERLSVNAAGIHFAGDDTQRLDYAAPADDEAVLPRRGARWPLVWNRETDEILITDPWSGHTRHFGTVHHQEESGQIRDLTAITDRNGNRIGILRDQHGTPVAVEHPGYRVAVDTVATAGGPRISALRLQEGAHASEVVLKRFHYDDRGRLTGVVNSSGLPFTYEWDESDRIEAWQDRAGFRYAYMYDDRGRVVHGEGAYLSGSFHYDEANRTTTVTDSLGNDTVYRYDQNGHVVSETDPLGNTVVSVADLYGRVLSRTDALGGTTYFDRDENGDIRRVVAPDGGTTAFEYNAFHQITAVIDPDGAQWHRAYDAAGNLVSTTNPAGAVTSFTFGAQGALTEVRNPLGAITRYTVDAAGLTTAVVDPLGAETRIERDTAGRPVRLTDPIGAVTTLAWTVEGRPRSRTAPDGATVRWEHDADGRAVKIVNAVGATTTFEPGPLDTLVARTDPNGVRHEFGYDTEQRLLQVTNSSGAVWSYAHDAAGRLIGETDFNGRQLSYEYDPAGRLVARTTGAGQVIALERDVAGRAVARTTAEGEYVYSYDAAGRLASATGPETSLFYERDVLGRVLAETVDGRTTRYTYDATGRRTGRTTASGAESRWSYDAAGRPAGLDAGSGRLDFAFDASGREIERLFGPQTWLARTYDPAGRLATQHLGTGERSSGAESVATDPIVSRSWAWRADGVPEEIRDSLRGTRRITSDASGRITSVSTHTWSERYAYDAFGNLTTPDTGSAEDEATEPTIAARTLIKRMGRTRHEYDAAGRVTTTTRRTLDGRRRTWRYTWDSQDRLVQAETPDRGVWRYTYDPAGRRTAKLRIGDDGAVSEQVLFSWDGFRLAEQQGSLPDGNGTTLTWDYDPGTFRPAVQRRRTWDASEQDAVDEAFHAIVTDLVGMPTELVDADGRIVWHTTTNVWGNTTSTTAEAGLECPLRFPGQYHDPETGLHYNLHRYYNPETAAYLTPDPLGLAPAPNDHAYVPNPLVLTDPLGLACGEDDEEAPAGHDADQIADHVVPRHTLGGDEADETKSLFDEGVDLQELANGSIGRIGKYQEETGNIRYIIDAGRIIGTDLKGNATNVYTIIRSTGMRPGNWQHEFDDLVTMHPGLPRDLIG